MDSTTRRRYFAASAGSSSGQVSPPPPPPPPPPPTPIVLGSTSPTAVLLTPGVTYIVTLPSATSGYGYYPSPTSNMPTLTLSATSVVPTSNAGCKLYGGIPAGNTQEAARTDLGTITANPHVGPDAIVSLAQNGSGSQTLTFTCTA